MFEVARGWYLVAWSADVARGAVLPLRLFARDYVLYRGEDGAPVLFDAHCPHRGAHLGYGGRVRGCAIECPYHGWRFGKDGRCEAIPHTRAMPAEAAEAAVRAHIVREHSGMILAWYACDEANPDYEVPEIAELSDPAWTPLERAQVTIATQAREVIENIGDRAHFYPVHKTKLDDFDVTIDGPRATQRTVGVGRNLKGEKIRVESIATYHGPAVQFTRLAWAFPMVLINAHVPIDEARLLVRFGVSLRAGEGITLPPGVLEAHVASARDGYFQDVAIWENKRWRDRPMLVEGDGPIARVRRWYQSFFPIEEDHTDP